MNISTFARRVGISPSGVRWYEAAGILPRPVRRDNGYREYSDADVSRLTLILALRRLGLTPADAGRLVDRCLEGEVTDPVLTDTLEEQRRQIARQREDLDRLELELVDLERTLSAVDPGRRTDERTSPIGVLFVCNGNSARSQIAEALLARFGEDDFDAVSAGTRPREVHELAVRVLAEVGIDWRTASAKSVKQFLDRRFDYVVTLSNSAREECPTLAGPHSSLHWHLDDPSKVAGSDERRMEAFRATRTELTVRLRPFIEIARRAAGRLPRCRRARATLLVEPGRQAGRLTQLPRKGVLPMQLPYTEPLTPREPAERVIPEPPRRGERDGEPCGLCGGRATAPVWSDEHFSIHPPVNGSLPGAVWLASREHVDSFSDLSPEAAAAFGPLAARVERAILALGDVGRVHLYRWGDGGAHFHVWFMPRPLGMLEAAGMMLPLWEDVLPNVSNEELADAAKRVAANL